MNVFLDQLFILSSQRQRWKIKTLQYSLLHLRLVLLTNRCSHSVTLGVNETSDLREVTVSLADVLDAGGLHQHGVVCRQDPGDAFPVVLNQCSVLPATHKRPHLLVGGDLWFLPEEPRKSWWELLFISSQHMYFNTLNTPDNHKHI